MTQAAANVHLEATGVLQHVPSAALRINLPDAPLLLSGVVGGPAAIFSLTPLRNGLTLGSQDRVASMRQLYGKVFRGSLRAGWLGGFAPAVVACPQFVALGPVYHSLHSLSCSITNLKPEDKAVLPSVMATLGAGICETLITYGSQARNAQTTYNNSLVCHSSISERRPPLPLTKAYAPWGVGAIAMTCRNTITLGSVRTLSPVFAQHLPLSWDATARATLGDFAAATFTCVLSAPLSQIFNFLVTTQYASQLPLREKAALVRRFLKRQYLVETPVGWNGSSQQARLRLSPVAARDFGMRTVYVASCLTMFTSIERLFCNFMRE
jgi:hypothetical protein